MGHYRKQLITFNITNQCNLRCSYCWAEKKKTPETRVLDIDFAKQGLCDFYQQTGSNYLGFTGGEATLLTDAIDEILVYARTLIGEIKVELQTNGYFSKATCQWVYDNVDIAWISTDGPPEIHDINRLTTNGTGSGSVVMRNLKNLLDIQANGSKEMTIGVRTTVGQYNVYQQKELIDYYLQLGVKVMYVSPLFKPVGAQEPLPNAIDYLLFAQQYYEAFVYAKSVGMFYGTFAMVNFDEPVEIACRALTPLPHLMPEGFVSACEMCYETESGLDLFAYGKWDQKTKTITYDQDKIDTIRSRTIYNLQEPCKSCDILHNCAGGCAGEVFSETGSLYKRESERCKLTQYLAERMELNSGLYPYFHS